MTRSRIKSLALSRVEHTDGGQKVKKSKGSQTMFKRFAIYLQNPVAFWSKHVFMTSHIAKKNISTVGQNSVRELSRQFVN